MDGRWTQPALNSTRDVRVFLHPIATIAEVRSGVYDTASPPEDDSLDVTPFLAEGNQGQFETQVTLKWNLELFGALQPRPNWVLEVQMAQDGVFQPIWIGIVDSVSNITISRGERALQLTARSRDSQHAWKTTKRVTDMFPALTDMAYIARRVAASLGLQQDEIDIPMSAYLTAHSNTQLAEMTGWDMLNAVLLPMGLLPFVDALGRLKTVNKDLQGRPTDILLDGTRIIKANGSDQTTPASRVRILWLNPELKRSLQQTRKLVDVTMTMGWFLPYLRRTVYFSEDKTQRAMDTQRVIKNSVNLFTKGWCLENYEQTGENQGRIELINFGALGIFTLIALWHSSHSVPDTATTAPGAVTPTGRRVEAIYQLAFTIMLMSIGTGIYEIWGTPYEWVHARNTTEVFNRSLPKHGDNPLEIESDFVVSEAHALAMATRELIFNTRSASKWTVELVDDLRVEYGDVLEFPDGNRFFVEDFQRGLTRGGPAKLQVEGFLF